MNIKLKQLQALVANENDLICNLANISAFLYEFLHDVNWVGFYLFKQNELVLGPFQGKIACQRIPLNKGVCGHVATTKQWLYVENVHEFEGHIACDSASNSEIVFPIIKNQQLFGVLDIDSFQYANFSDSDILFLQEVVKIINTEITNWI